MKKKYGIEDIDSINDGIKDSLQNHIKDLHNNFKNEIDKGTSDVYEIILKLNSSIKEKINDEFKKYDGALKKIHSNNKKNILQKIKDMGILAQDNFFTNLHFFNNSKNKFGKDINVLNLFDELLHEYLVIENKKIKGIPLDVVDKRLNPLIYSSSQFKNIYYGRPMTLKDLEKVFDINPVYYILSFPESFIWIKGKNYMFYTPSLKFSYEINKKLKTYMKSLTENANENTFLELTWKILIDKIVEYKSKFYLDQMYIVEYSGISNQQILNVEYIGLSRLQSKIILDDILRENLNKKLADIAEKDHRTVRHWLLEEFIKNSPILPFIMRYLHGRLSPPKHWKDEKTKKLKQYVDASKSTLIYALSLEGTLKIFKDNKKIDSPFDGDFFVLEHDIVKYVKENAKKMMSASTDISIILKEVKIEVLANHLLTTIKRNNRSSFINILMKNFLNIDQTEEMRWRFRRLNSYIFNFIISNDTSWKEFALPIVIGLIYGGEKE